MVRTCGCELFVTNLVGISKEAQSENVSCDFDKVLIVDFLVGMISVVLDIDMLLWFLISDKLCGFIK